MVDAQPAVYWPSCKVRLGIRLDNFLPLSPTITVQIPALGAEAFRDDPRFIRIKDIIPYNLHYELNSYRQADTCNFSIPYRALPIDPRIIRACRIQVFAGTITAQSFALANGPIQGAQAVVADFEILAAGGHEHDEDGGERHNWPAPAQNTDAEALHSCGRHGNIGQTCLPFVRFNNY